MKLLLTVVVCVVLAATGCMTPQQTAALQAQATTLQGQLTAVQQELAAAKAEAAAAGQPSAEAQARIEKLETLVAALDVAIGKFSAGAAGLGTGTTTSEKVAGVAQLLLGLLGVAGAAFGVTQKIKRSGVDAMLNAVIHGVEKAGDGAKVAVNTAATNAGVQPALHKRVSALT